MNPEEVLSIRPDVRETPTGWLAVSERGSGLSIGVVGATAEAAVANFEAALKEWARLAALPDPWTAPS